MKINPELGRGKDGEHSGDNWTDTMVLATAGLGGLIVATNLDLGSTPEPRSALNHLAQYLADVWNWFPVVIAVLLLLGMGRLLAANIFRHLSIPSLIHQELASLIRRLAWVALATMVLVGTLYLLDLAWTVTP